MKRLNVIALVAFMLACRGSGATIDEKEGETQEERSLVVESDIVGHWTPHEYPVR